MGGSTSALKRSYNQDDVMNSEECSEIKAKRSKTFAVDENNDDRSKRMPKPVKRFDPTQLESPNTNLKER